MFNLKYRNERANFCSVSRYLYHAVPEKYAPQFEQGRLVLDSANKIRENEEKLLKQPKEYGLFSDGEIRDVYRSSNLVTVFSLLDEFFLFCFSTSRDIKVIRENLDPKQGGISQRRVLYEVDMEKLVPAILHSLDTTKVVTPGGLHDFETGKKINDRQNIAIQLMGGAIKYISPRDRYSPIINRENMPFCKHLDYMDEKEVRLVFKIWEMTGRKMLEGEFANLSTTGDNRIVIKINPNGCFRKITS